MKFQLQYSRVSLLAIRRVDCTVLLQVGQREVAGDDYSAPRKQMRLLRGDLTFFSLPPADSQGKAGRRGGEGGDVIPAEGSLLLLLLLLAADANV